MWRGDTVAFAATKDLGDGLDSDGGADVDVAEDGGASHVEPIRVIGSKLLEAGSLHQVHVFWNLDFASPGR